MRRLVAIAILVTISITGGMLGQTRPQPEEQRDLQPEARDASPFTWVDVIIDTGPAALAVYQLELVADPDTLRIVGVEGSSHAAFAKPPYYDPAAMQGERLIIGAFSKRAAHELPAGRTTIATIHVERLGDAPARFESTLVVCADTDANPIVGRITLEPGGGR